MLADPATGVAWRADCGDDGIVFFGHQVGSFLGVWLGGYLYDASGSYDLVWWTGAALGLAAAFIHLPINERPLQRLAGETR